MSAPKYRIPPKFLCLLHERDLRVCHIAERAGLGISTAQKALARHPLTGEHHRAKLAPHLTHQEHLALGWNWRGQLLPVEQFSVCSDPFRSRQPNLTPNP